MKIRNPIAAFHVAWSLVQRREGRELQALRLAEKAYRACRVGAPSEHAPVLLNAFYADLCERTGDFENAYHAARATVLQVNEINEGARRGYPTKAEDQWFMLYWMKYILVRISGSATYDAWSFALAIPATYASLDLPRTSNILKDMFTFDRDWAMAFDLTVERARDQ
jgi:hypothetical protein